ncbi:hypothetical protein NDU88_003455 [Pleurodeles waltl]|uniref:Uncharacterized protein n=1 Tax=Pleurodeles waltl TaxID=8319 RepID=A0AAV7T678_PLEWA|nr:hypothetical protein NDU88_003455 [Pleurodeles waltl]
MWLNERGKLRGTTFTSGRNAARRTVQVGPSFTQGRGFGSCRRPLRRLSSAPSARGGGRVTQPSPDPPLVAGPRRL